MNRVPRLLLIAAGALVVLGIAAVIAINLYVQSGPVQARIAEAVGPAIGPVRIARTGWTPWGGLQLHGIQSEPEAGTRLEADTLVLRVDLLPLLARQVNVREFRIESPRIAVDRSVRPTPTPEPTPEARPSPGGKPPGTPKSQEPRKPRAAVLVRVQKAAVNHGSLLVKDARGQPLLHLQDYSVQSVAPSAKDASGNFHVGSVAVRNAFSVSDIGGPFRLRANTLELPDVRGQMAGGTLRGSVVIRDPAGQRSGRVELVFAGVDMAGVVEAAGGPRDRASGRLDGEVRIEGDPAAPQTLNGNGSFRLTDGSFRQYELLQTLGQALQIEELMQLKFSKAGGTFRIGAGRVLVDRIEIASENLHVTASGTIESDGRLALEAVLQLHRKISRRLPGSKENMTDVAGKDDWRQLTFTVGGTVTDPESDLVNRLVGDEWERKVDGVLQSLFGGGEKKKKDKKKEPSKPKPTPSARPVPSPEAVPTPYPVPTPSPLPSPQRVPTPEPIPTPEPVPSPALETPAP
jgi:uncharacterized protein involved in outer membrane biogenesis